jgi:hypothetical protein
VECKRGKKWEWARRRRQRIIAAEGESFFRKAGGE